MRPPYHPPTGPGRPTRPPWIGPAIGTGVVIGAIGAAAASAPPPPPMTPPPPPSFGGPSGPSGPVGPQGPSGPTGPGAAINIPPANEQRFVPNEVVLEFAGNYLAQAITDTGAAASPRPARPGQPAEHQLDLFPCPHHRRPPGAGGARCAAQRDHAARRPAELSLRSAQQAGQPRPSSRPQPPCRRPRRPRRPPARCRRWAIRRNTRSPSCGSPEAHGLTRGNNVLVAVIDSGIDASAIRSCVA